MDRTLRFHIHVLTTYSYSQAIECIYALFTLLRMMIDNCRFFRRLINFSNRNYRLNRLVPATAL